MITSFSFDQSLISKHSIEAEASQEHYETNDMLNEALQTENLKIDRERFFRREERFL